MSLMSSPCISLRCFGSLKLFDMHWEVRGWLGWFEKLVVGERELCDWLLYLLVSYPDLPDPEVS
jgi:hypothetical protein